MFYVNIITLGVPLSPRAAEQREVGQPTGPTWIHEIFQGALTNETKCLCCETVRSKDEDFLDLSVDVEQNTSLTHCLR
jgi:hypothetical protein